MWISMYLLCFLIKNWVKSEDYIQENYSFQIDYDNDQFLLDGKPFRYISGSFHYFRAPNEYWRPLFRKMRAAGLNAVSTIVEWSLHEPEPEQYNWDGDADIIKFIETAKEEDLLVILRPGPYTCAERDLGGLPYWLLRLVPDIKLRSNDQRYLFYVERYLNKLLTKIEPYLRGNGGPVIMLQIENEYGTFLTCSTEYKQRLYNIFSQHVKTNAVLFTTDKARENTLRCGSIPDTLTTIDFGSGGDVETNYKLLRQFTPKGPVVNSEYYTGVFGHWNLPNRKINTERLVNNLDLLLSYNFSMNFYMFFGGTNFGFSNGANMLKSFSPQLTSYDYDAPISEAGDLTPKYFELKKTILKYVTPPQIDVPTAAPKGNYGTLIMVPTLDLFTPEARNIFGTPQQEFREPPTFEALTIPHWLVLYEANLSDYRNLKNSSLSAKIKDRALVYVNNNLSGILSRMDNSDTISLSVENDSHLKLLVENTGRITSGHYDVEDVKGISDVIFNGVQVAPWNVTGFLLSSVTAESLNNTHTKSETGKLISGPQFLVGSLDITDQPLDTFLNTEGWGKGVAYINGRNLGRYWPSVGPQITLYVPAPYLKTGRNSIVLLELENVKTDRTIQFQTKPILDNYKSI